MPRDAIAEHAACVECPLRRVMPVGPPRCRISRRSLVAHARAEFCPHPDGPRHGAATPPEGWEPRPGAVPSTQPFDWTGTTRALWDELHRQALAATAVATFARYVRESFTPRVLCGPCKVKWQAILERMPPEAAVDPFAWSVDAHNAVNVELDPPKPVVSLEEARRLHEPTTGGRGG